MRKVRLNSTLLNKLSKKTGKGKQYLREQISKRASKNGMASESALTLWCRDMGIGVAAYLRKLPSHIQDQVRNSSSNGGIQYSSIKSSKNINARKRGTINQRTALQSTINFLIRDRELHERCQDLLKASKHFDRVIREATTILDDRLKRLTNIENMKPSDLVGKVLNPDPQKAVIVMSSNKFEQEGFHGICKGIILSFRDTTHHRLSDKFTREDAMKFCGFIDTLLGLLNKSPVYKDRI